MRYFIDCEFDGHNGPLLSIAAVADNARSIYIKTTEQATDPWVLEHVIPILDNHNCSETYVSHPNAVGALLQRFIKEANPIIIADSPVDIGRFCNAISTSPRGEWQPTEFNSMTFYVLNVNAYPTELEGAVQHNAWWDAAALKHHICKPEEGSHYD